MKDEIGIEATANELVKIAEMDNPAHMDQLAKIGRKAAEKQVKLEHFPAAFDVT